MSASQITQRALAQSLKKLMLTTPLHKITIHAIVEDCGLTRHTFYNHFQDIYDLLGWVYKTEVIQNLAPYRNYAGWRQGFFSVLEYIQKNKTICLNTFHSLGRDHLERFLYDVIYEVMISVVNELAEETEADNNTKVEIADFYTWAILAQTIQWLRTNADSDPAEIVTKVQRVMEGSIKRSLERYREDTSASASSQAGIRGTHSDGNV